MERAVESIVRQPLLVPESKPVDDLFHEMQRSRQHVAVVVDEYGGIAGMVTIEDAIEQIVGEGDVSPIPTLPVPGLVARDQEDRLSAGIEGEQDAQLATA